jgi:hypothetical protein
VRGLADMLSNHFGAQPEAIAMKPSRDDVLRLVDGLPQERVEAAWHGLVTLL